VAEPQGRALPRQPDKAAEGPSVRGHDDGTAWPKLSVIGGGYAGTDGNHIVRRMEGYTDVWWKYNGPEWTQVNHKEGYKESLYSTNKWSRSNTNNRGGGGMDRKMGTRRQGA